MMNSENDPTVCCIFGACLKVAQCIIAASQANNACGSISPGQIHSMIISHSSFSAAISYNSCSKMQCDRPNKYGDLCDGLTQQSELIRLMTSCVSLDTDRVKFEWDTWATIISVYNASTCDIDRMLRRLMFLYEQNGCCNDEVSVRRGVIASSVLCANFSSLVDTYYSTIRS
jgi:hypothetical protein